jgi:hypothetical protein
MFTDTAKPSGSLIAANIEAGVADSMAHNPAYHGGVINGDITYPQTQHTRHQF